MNERLARNGRAPGRDPRAALARAKIPQARIEEVELVFEDPARERVEVKASSFGFEAEHGRMTIFIRRQTCPFGLLAGDDLDAQSREGSRDTKIINIIKYNIDICGRTRRIGAPDQQPRMAHVVIPDLKASIGFEFHVSPPGRRFRRDWRPTDRPGTIGFAATIPGSAGSSTVPSRSNCLDPMRRGANRPRPRHPGD